MAPERAGRSDTLRLAPSRAGSSDTLRLAPERTASPLRERLVARYRREIGPLHEGGFSSIRNPDAGPNTRVPQSFGTRSRLTVSGGENTYGRMTATSLRAGDTGARSTQALATLYASRTRTPASSMADSRARSGAVLYWGTTAIGSRSVVGTYLRVPLAGGGSVSPYFYHHTYHRADRWRASYWHGGYGYYGGGYGYYPAYSYGWGYYRPYYRSGLYIGWGLGWGLGWGWWGGSYLGIYDPWPYYAYNPYYWSYPRYYSAWYRPYYGDNVTYNYYYYNDDDPEPVVVERAEGSPTSGARPVSGVQPVGGVQPTSLTPAEAVAPAADDEAFLQSLNPAELAFVTGLVSFRGGEYEQAAQAWYNATLKSPDAIAPRMFLAIGLFGLGEYQRAAEYLRDAVKRNPEVASYHWDVRRLYGKTNAAGFERHLQTLDSYIELYPNQADAYLVRGFVLSGTDDTEGAARAFENARTIDPNDAAAEVFAKNVKERGKTMYDEFQTFLNTMRLEDVQRLKL